MAQACTSDRPAVIPSQGAVLDLENRAVIRQAGLVVWLRADVATLAARVGVGTGRPLLDGGPAAALARLVVERAPVYAELADLVYDVDRLSPAGGRSDNRHAMNEAGPGADGVTSSMNVRSRSQLGDRSYPVLVGSGARHRLAELIPLGATRAAIVTQEAIPWTVDSGIEQYTFFLGDGEEAKNLESVEELCRGFARWGVHRSRM